MDATDGDIGASNRRKLVVVPHVPGPLFLLDARRGRDRDDLDDLIDDLFPDVEERPGWFDAGLLVLGAGLLTWGALGGAPTSVTVLGIVAVVLGCVLPIRTMWRRSQRRQQQRRREALLAKGAPVDVSSAVTERLVEAYESLLRLGDVREDALPAIAAAHGALLEVASLLGGRPPGSASEREYIEKRAVAVEVLSVALRELSQLEKSASGVELSPGALVEARDELDQLVAFGSVSRLEELTREVRMQRRGRD